MRGYHRRSERKSRRCSSRLPRTYFPLAVLGQRFVFRHFVATVQGLIHQLQPVARVGCDGQYPASPAWRCCEPTSFAITCVSGNELL